VREAVKKHLTSNPRKLRPLLRKDGVKISMNELKTILNSMEAIQKLGDVKRITQQHSARFPNHKWYIDLIDMKPVFKIKGFLFTILDYYSRYAWVFFIDNKRMDSVYDVFYPLYEKYKPYEVIGDKGREWNKIKKIGVFYLTTVKGSVTPIESFNRTIIKKLNLLFTLEGKKGWRDKLARVLKTYNNSKHSITRQKPSQVFKLKKYSKMKAKHEKWKLAVGDYVRVILKFSLFAKKARVEKLSGKMKIVKIIGQNRYELSDGKIYTSSMIQPA